MRRVAAEAPMRRTAATAIAALAAAVLGACAAEPPVPHAPTARLAAYLIGQYTAESSTHLGDVTRLRIDAVFLEEWDPRQGLYLLASAQLPEDRWRPTLYRLVGHAGGEVTAEAWHADDARLLRANDPLPAEEIEALGREAFRRTEACDLLFQYGEDGVFDGEHRRRGACEPPGEPPEVAYVWTRLRVAPEEMVWFPQHFSADDELVATPEPGGYRFEQVSR